MSSDDLKSSARVWGGSNIQQDSPPAYTGNPDHGSDVRQRTTASRRIYDPIKEIARLSKVHFSKFDIPDAVTSPDKSIITTTYPQLFLSPEALLKFMTEQAELPPMPLLRVTGTHNEHVSSNPKVDFDLTLNLVHLLDLSGARWRVKSAHSEPLPGSSKSIDRASNSISSQGPLALWTTRFCKEKAENKSFSLARSIPNLPVEIMEGQVRTLLASLKYRGKVSITFPLQHSKVIVHKQASNWFINMLRIYPEKKYDVIETIWDISSGLEEEASADTSADAGALAKEWWNSWQPVVKNSILGRRIGNVGIDEWIGTQMGHREKEPLLDWGQDYHS